jgi:hypothetical protein
MNPKEDGVTTYTFRIVQGLVDALLARHAIRRGGGRS